MFAIRENWLSKTISVLKDEELHNLFAEIYSYRETGVLKGKYLRAMEHSVSEHVTHTPAGEMIRTIENAVLFEMARRYANITEPTKNVTGDNLPDDLDALVLNGTKYIKLSREDEG